MKKDILLLTKSRKTSPRTESLGEDGFCVAGIDMKTGEWIRLVAEGPEDDESLIDNDLLDEFGYIAEPLDVVCVDVIRPVPNGCQSENWLMDTDDYIDILGHASLRGLFSKHVAELPEFVYGNEAEALNGDEIEDIDYSLILIPATDVRIYNTGFGNHRRTKVSFTYNGCEYKDLSMTDPDFYSRTGETLDYAFIVVSLPHDPWNNGLYYKFVAKILEVSEDEFEAFKPNEVEIDYDETMTIGEAYEMYAEVLDPLIVVADGWTNDYCFVIKGINGADALGIAFRAGEYYDERKFSLNKSIKLYNGPSVDAIRDYMQNLGNE